MLRRATISRAWLLDTVLQCLHLVLSNRRLLHPSFNPFAERASTCHITAVAMNHDKDIAVSSTTMPSYNHGKANEYIRASEVPQESDMRSQVPPRRSFIEKLGLYNIGVLVFGAVASCLAMAFLALLWSGSETARNGRPTPVLWFGIVETPNWATRLVTIGSVVVRLATAAQMGVFAALIAAWTLETNGASAEYLPLLSIIRTVNNGPQSHIWNVFHSLRIGSRKLYCVLVTLAILDVLALQFTSTLLVTDFAMAKIVSGAVNQSIAYGISQPEGADPNDAGAYLDVNKGVDFNLAGPPTYPRFAELSTPGSAHLDNDVADTGTSLRAYLPFGLPDRRAILREYRGPAAVVDTRVRCFRPSISINNISFVYQSGTNEPYEIIVLGNITMKDPTPGIVLNVTEDSEAGSFLTIALARIYAKTTDWRLSYSIVNVGEAYSIDQPFDISADAASTDMWSFLLLNVTGNDWGPVLEGLSPGNSVVGPYNWTQQSSGVWSNLRTTNDTIDIGLSATVCFTAVRSRTYQVHANSEIDFAEPRNMSWDSNLWKYETGDVRKLLGASQQNFTHRERGILSLQKPSNWTEILLDTDQMDYSGFVGSSILNSLTKLEYPYLRDYYPDLDSMRGIFAQAAVLSPNSEYNSVNRLHAGLFQDIIQTTNNPALAMQAMFTTIMQMAYYNSLPMFSHVGPASVATSETLSIPVHWTGFGIVMSLLVIHAILVITAVCLFLSKTDHSLLGNAWQAVAQVSSSDTMDTVHHASNMTDLEVKRLLRMNSSEDNEIVLRTGADGGRSQAVYRRGTGDSY